MSLRDVTVESVLPRADLDASFEAVRGHVRQLWPRHSLGGLEQTLRASLARFVRGELHRAIAFPGQLDQWADVLPPQAAMRIDVSADTLRRQASCRASQWRTTILELLQRLETDWDHIVRHFDIHREACLAAVSAPLGDPHNDGRSVYKLTFNDGGALIYKPRPVDAEAAFGKLLDWIRQTGCEPDLAHYLTLPRRGYGWTQFVRTVLCRTSFEALAYYQRQGAFLAIFFRLCGSDVIADNVVVSGGYPIWVDMECMCRPDLPFAAHDSSSFPEWMRESILTTGMVLYGGDRPDIPLRARTGLSVSCVANRAEIFADNGALKAPYADAVVEGFRNTYLWLLAHGAELAPDRELLNSYRSCPVRVLLRSTHTYVGLLTLLTVTPERHMSDTRKEVAAVLRQGRQRRDTNFPNQIVEAEMCAIERGDVPYWLTSVASHDLWEAGGGQVRSIARLTCMEAIERRGARMNETDLSLQLWLLESFLKGFERGRRLQ